MSTHHRPFIAPMQFDDAQAAYDQVLAIYDTNIAYLRDAMKRFVAGEDVGEHVRACYAMRFWLICWRLAPRAIPIRPR